MEYLTHTMGFTGLCLGAAMDFTLALESRNILNGYK